MVPNWYRQPKKLWIGQYEMGIAERFNTLISNLTLTQNQMADAKTKLNGVCNKLHDAFYTTSYNGETVLVIGSYGKGTQVRPPRDVDVLFKMPWGKFKQYDSHAGNGQSQLLQDLRNVLLRKYSYVNIRGDGQVVVVPFEGGHDIEVLPAWQFDNGQYYIPDTHEGGKWKVVDPIAERNSVDISDRRSNGNTRNLIKMIKTWQSLCNVPIKSLVIELRV